MKKAELQQELLNIVERRFEGIYPWVVESQFDQKLGVQSSQFSEDEDVPEAARQSSYRDLAHLFDWMADNGHQSLLDVGASYGRSLILAEFWERAPAVFGVEIDEGRVSAGKAVLKNAERLFCQDVTSLDLEAYEVFFLYFDHNEVVMNLLAKLCFSKRSKRPLIVVQEAHGASLGLFRAFLSKQLTYAWKSDMPRHDPLIEIYEVPFLLDKIKLDQKFIFSESLETLANVLWASLREDAVIEIGDEIIFSHQMVLNPFGQNSRQVLFPKLRRTHQLDQFMVRQAQGEFELLVLDCPGFSKYSLRGDWVEWRNGSRKAFGMGLIDLYSRNC